MADVTLTSHNDDHPHGKFGMSLEEAKESFLGKVKDIGLGFKLRTGGEGEEAWICVDLSNRSGANPRMMWEELCTLATEFGASSDESGDPPWEYVLKYEKPVKQAPKGQYIRI